MKNPLLSIALLAMVHLMSPANADATSITLGNASPGFTNGQTGIGTATVLTAMTGSPAPFNAICGSDTANPPGNCVTSWTFTYSLASGDVVTAASLTLGIWDLDSKATGSQVALYQVVGGDVLTTTFNTAAEALHTNVGSASGEYDEFTFALSNFSALNGGSATIQLGLQNGLGVLGNTAFNGAGLLFSTLNLTIESNPNGGGDGGGGNPDNPAVPEPATLLLVATGVGAVARRRRTRD